MQNIKAISLSEMIAAPSVNKNSIADSSGDFQKYMDDNTGTSSCDAESAKTVSEVKVTKDRKSSGDMDSNQQVYSVSSQAETDENTVSEIDVAKVELVVRDAVKSELHIDEETLDTVMAEMGISVLQLLDPLTLQQFMVNCNPGSDVTDFLTSETMLRDFTELLQVLEDIDWEGLTGMSKEDFLQTLENMPDQDLSEGILELVDLPEEVLESENGENLILSEDVVEQTTEPEKGAVMNQNIVSDDKKMPDDTNITEPKAETVSAEKMQTMASAGSTGENASQSQLPGQSSRNPLQDVQPMANQSVTMMDFVENMMQATDTAQSADTVKMQQMIDIVNQVVERIQSSVREDTTTMEMQLNPESLGKVLLSVSNRNGVMTAGFTVQTAEAKEALESQMYNLRETLEQKNLKVESVEVTVSDFTFSQSGQADTGDQKDFRQGHGKRMRFQFDEEEQDEISAEKEAEQVRRSVMRDSGSSVDYTA